MREAQGASALPHVSRPLSPLKQGFPSSSLCVKRSGSYSLKREECRHRGHMWVPPLWLVLPLFSLHQQSVPALAFAFKAGPHFSLDSTWSLCIGPRGPNSQHAWGPPQFVDCPRSPRCWQFSEALSFLQTEGSASGGRSALSAIGQGYLEGQLEASSKGPQHAPRLASGPSRGEIVSFFRFLEASMPPQPHRQHPQQQEQAQLRSPLSAAVDAVLFLAGCAVSPHCRLRISKHPWPRTLSEEASVSDNARNPDQQQQQQQQQKDAWLLLCYPSPAAALPEALPLQTVTALFASLGQLVFKLQGCALTRLLPALFLLSRSLGIAGCPSVPPKEVHALAHALLLLLQGVLQRAAQDAALLPAAETVQRVTAVTNALADWSTRACKGSPEKPTPLILFAQRDGLASASCFQDPTPSGATGGAGAAALAIALQRSGAPLLPQELLHASAGMLEASAAAAAHGLAGVQQQELHSLDQHLQPQQQIKWSHQPPTMQLQQSDDEGLQKKPADAMRQLVAASVMWLPVYYLLIRLNGGIWLSAVQQLAEAAAIQEARLLRLFLSQQEQHQQKASGEAGTNEVQRDSWGAVCRLLYGQLQQLAVSLARIRSIKPLRGIQQFAAAAEAFDRFLSSQAFPTPPNGPAAGGTTSPLLRPLLHTRDPPLDLKEAERRIRFFCALVTLGARGSHLTSGVSACLPSESQLHTLLLLERQQQQHQQQQHQQQQHQQQQHQQQQQKRSFHNHSPEAAAAKCAQLLPLQLLQRLMVSCNCADEKPLASRGLKVLRLRLDSLTLQHVVRAHLASQPNSSRGARTALASGAAANEGYTAELVGKTLALLHKSVFRHSHGRAGREEKYGPVSSIFFEKSSTAAEETPNEGPSQLEEAICGLASAATLWAAVTGFDGQSPEDVALLTFSLIPFWLQQNGAAGTTPIHTEQHVQHIRAAAAATKHQQEQQQQQLLHARQQGGLTEQLITNVTRNLQGSRGFFQGPAVYAPRSVSSAAVEFYLSELTNKRGLELPVWPSPLLFLLAYNVLRLRLSRGSDWGKGFAASPAVSAATGAKQQQLSSAAEAAAAQLLLRVVAAIEESITFPDGVNAQCRQEIPGGCKVRAAQPSAVHQRPQRAIKEEASGAAALAGEATTTVEARAAIAPAADTAAAKQCSIRLADLREVGSFLWALSRAEGGCDTPIGPGASATLRSPTETKALAAEVPLLPSVSRLISSSKPYQQLTIQEASRIATQAIKRPGGFADKLAVYCEAAIRGANDLLLQRSAAPATSTRSADCRRPGQRASADAPAAAAKVDVTKVQLHSALQALKTFCKETPDTCKPAVSLRASDLPSPNWVSAAGVSLGLLLSFFSSCRPDTRQHILSAVLHAPMLAAECGLLQLFHLLRPLAASARSEVEGTQEADSEATAPLPFAALSLPPQDHKQHQLPGAPTRLQKAMPNISSSRISFLSLLKEAPAFIFAVAVGLLRHAQTISNLPADVPRIAAQVQLLLLAASDFATLLHAHCLSAEASREDVGIVGSSTGRPVVVTISASFRRVLQKLLSLLSNIVVRHSGQICGSLALLAAAAEILSRCGRHVSLPPGSKKAMETFAPAAIAALRQPTVPHLPSRGLSQQNAIQGQRVGGAEELKRLAAALEALKFVELQ